MLEIEKAIQGKTLEELKPKDDNIVHPKEYAPYAYKKFLERCGKSERERKKES